MDDSSPSPPLRETEPKKEKPTMPPPSNSNAPLDDTTIPSNESSEIDNVVHVHPSSSTNNISASDIPSDLVKLATIILNPLDND